MSAKYDAVVAGHICFDIIPAFKISGVPDMSELFKPGKLVNMGDMSVSSGGPVSNTGLAMGILGCNVELMGKSGDDFFGKGLVSLLEKYDVTVKMTVVPGEQTSYTVVMVPGDVDRIFLHCPGANDTFGPDDVNYDLVKEARLFHLGYPPLMKGLYSNNGQGLIEIYKRVKELGVTTSLDMSLVDPDSESGKVDWRDILENLMPHLDIFLPSGEEAMFMLDRKRFDELTSQARGSEILHLFTIDDMRSLSKTMIDAGVKMAVIKMGSRGMYVRTAGADQLGKIGAAGISDIDNWANRELWEEAFYVEEVAAATGSGDSAIAGFLTSYLKGKSIEEALKIACCVGGQNVQVMDAVSGIHTWDETIAMLGRWEKRRQDIKEAGWEYDDKGLVWIGGLDKKA